ncbi:cyclodeaminase/cyclohydrolase family protein [Mycoplasma sp. P36-A1]|uniref:cyclodeaminase/cyclohydrolase family protein n=1 Tax=Mycoplasma sp. P36-A1 TaxID=3252900 RepID=UPI003C2B68C2
MKLIDMKLTEFSAAVDSDAPAPGGGSVAAYVSNLGVALSRMMAHLTINKKKFSELDEKIQQDFKDTFNKLENSYNRLMEMVDEDTESFNKVMAAFKLAKETDEDKKIRSQAIQDATLEATKAPLEAAEIAFNALNEVPKLIENGNSNAISDLASGMYLLEAGMNCSILNVKINASGLKDEKAAKEFLEKCATMQFKAHDIVESNMKIIEKML